MPLHLTKVAFGHDSLATLQERAREGSGLLLTTRYLPKRAGEIVGNEGSGGSLYWIIKHQLVARSPILGFGEAEGGRVSIELGPRLIVVEPRRKRAHQGWRYLEDADAPADLGGGADGVAEMPAALIGKLSELALI